MNDIPFYDLNKDGLFYRANRRNHTELFVVVQVPDYFTFIVLNEFLSRGFEKNCSAFLFNISVEKFDEAGSKSVRSHMTVTEIYNL